MANENSLEQGAQTWHVPQFHFSVEVSNVGKMSCKEVSGLDVEMDVIEYRSGDMQGGTNGKIPGLRKCGDVTLKKVMFKNDQKLWDWIRQIKRNTDVGLEKWTSRFVKERRKRSTCCQLSFVS